MNDFDKLELSTETIRELTGDELGAVAGGGEHPTTGCPTTDCLTGIYPTINTGCDTLLCKSLLCR